MFTKPLSVALATPRLRHTRDKHHRWNSKPCMYRINWRERELHRRSYKVWQKYITENSSEQQFPSLATLSAFLCSFEDKKLLELVKFFATSYFKLEAQFSFSPVNVCKFNFVGRASSEDAYFELKVGFCQLKSKSIHLPSLTTCIVELSLHSSFCQII
ncbi:hypothetical protein DFP73DRAFT_31280 [Morchella snyderi]|nr:hypothetical protein DFP73DRAFT_31280 [Morchella snyderi]